MQSKFTTKILITGICGFVGFRIASFWKQSNPGIKIIGVDNLMRAGSEINRSKLKDLGIEFYHGDIRQSSDYEALPNVDWVLDCAANPSVLAGVDGQSSSRQLMQHNLSGTIELLEYCKRVNAGFILLSTSRVYSIKELSELPTIIENSRYNIRKENIHTPTYTEKGITESFSTTPPLSLYGTSKRAAELLALEYGSTFDFPVWINRCGVMAAAGQFGKADQGIFSFWIHSHRSRKPLKYIGFGGSGFQVRDFFDPKDLVSLLQKQINCNDKNAPQIINIGGGTSRSMSLAELTNWCDDRFGKHKIIESPEIRQFDIPWLIMNNDLAENYWKWSPESTSEEILNDIALHAETNPHWLDRVVS